MPTRGYERRPRRIRTPPAGGRKRNGRAPRHRFLPLRAEHETGITEQGRGMHRYVNEARRLHAYLHSRHWDGRALTGPDAGVRVNYRVGRYVKSYLRFLPWRDDHYYLQAQAYWV